MAAVFASVEPELAALGFSFVRAVIHVPAHGEAHQSHAWEYVNPETRIWVTVRKLRIKTGLIPRCFFKSNLADGRMLMTSPSGSRKDSTEILLENEIPDMPIHGQYLAHLEFVRENAKGQQPLLLGPEAQKAEALRVWSESARLQAKRGQLFVAGDGRYAFTIHEAIRRAIRAHRKVIRMNRSQHVQATIRKIEASAPPPPSIPEETTEYEHINGHSHRATIHSVHRLIALLVPMAFLVLAFHPSQSWETLLAFVAAVTFHDCGQLLGMRLFGYRNLLIPYLPVLGALSGKPTRELIKPWQELVILFLGPFPGFAAGVLILLIPALLPFPFRRDLGLALLLFNAYNLLPADPLDGSRIWDVLLVRRYPAARSNLLLLAAFSMMGAGVLGAGTFPIGLFLLIQYSAQKHQAGMAYAWAAQLRSSLSRRDEKTLLPAIFEMARNQSLKLKGHKRIFFVRAVLEQCMTDPAGPATLILGLTAYILPILMGTIALHMSKVRAGALAAAAMAEARAEGLLDTPAPLIHAGAIDGTPYLVQIQELVKKSDADLKIQSVRAYLVQANPDKTGVRKIMSDPDITAMLAMARKLANSDYVRDTDSIDETRVSVDEIAQWLALSADSAATESDASTAWQDEEDALRIVCLQTMNPASGNGVSADSSLEAALDGLHDIMLRISPSQREITRLRALIAAGRIGQSILREHLLFDIAVEKELAQPERVPPNVNSLLVMVAAPDRTAEQLSYLSEIRQLKKQLQIAGSGPNPPDEDVFGPPSGEIWNWDGATMNSLLLARAALAMEEYRIAHGKLPATLDEIPALSAEQRNTIAWSPQSSRLKVKRVESKNGLSPFFTAYGEPNEDHGPSYGRRVPYAWDIRILSQK